MKGWIISTLAISMSYFIFGIVIHHLGNKGCWYGEEEWIDEWYEKAYYHFFAPVSAFFLFICIILEFVYTFLE